MAKKQKPRRKKPPGWAAFDALARKLVKVPKEEVDRRVEAERKQHPRAK